jgi:glycosyltransferase involved in cell wall biosynthesis
MRDMIVFGEDWASHPSSTQHLIKRLLPDHRVLWVNSIGLRRPRLTWHDAKRAWRKLVAACRKAPATTAPQPTPQAAKPILLSPRAIPWPGQPVLRHLNRWLLSNQLRTTMRTLNMQQPLLWISLPTAVDVIGTLGEHRVIYYCGDDFNALAGVDHHAVHALEMELAEKADLILAVSPRLAAKFPAKKTRLLPHGADVAVFQQASPRAPDLPNGQVIGFYGSISDWLDMDLLHQCITQLNNYQWVFVGPIRTDVSRLQALPNAHFLGERAHHQLACYSQHWDVSILPFCDNEQIRACNPLKLREYLAAGTPIVSTDFPALDEYRELIHVATTAADFCQAILAASHDQARNAARRASVRDETWEARVNQLRSWIDAL